MLVGILAGESNFEALQCLTYIADWDSCAQATRISTKVLIKPIRYGSNAMRVATGRPHSYVEVAICSRRHGDHRISYP